MKTYSDLGPAQAAAVARAYGGLAVILESLVFHTAEQCSAEYRGGCWVFVTNDAEDLGFWYPTGQPTYPVSCENYFQSAAMDAPSFGAACTVVALNHLIWRLHAKGLDTDALSDQFDRLRFWIFDVAESATPFLNGMDIAGFID